MKIEYECSECKNTFCEPIDDTKKAFEVKQYRCNCCDFGRKYGGLMTARITPAQPQG